MVVFQGGAMVVFQLAEQSLPTTEVCSLNPVISEFLTKIYFLSTELKRRK